MANQPLLYNWPPKLTQNNGHYAV